MERPSWRTGALIDGSSLCLGDLVPAVKRVKELVSEFWDAHPDEEKAGLEVA